MTSDCAPLSPRAATSCFSSRVHLLSPSHGPHAGSTLHRTAGNAKLPRGAGNTEPPAAGGSWVANDAKTNLPIQPSCFGDVAGIFYLPSAPVSPLQGQQRLFQRLWGQERFCSAVGRQQDQQEAHLQLQPMAPLLVPVSLWCSCS